MCELFGMSARHPTDVNHSLALLRPRGGEIGPHSDGWGVAFYEGRAARVFKEPIPAAESGCLAFISGYGFQSRIVVGHILRANPSVYGRSSANTHPFERELGGRSWVFAHNGKLDGLREGTALVPGRFHTIGETDSELAFCLLLDAIALQEIGTNSYDFAVVDAIGGLIQHLAQYGEFNFLLSDGERLFAHAHTRVFMAHRICREAGCEQEVVLLATAPLTDEIWTPLTGLRVFADGRELIRPPALPAEKMSA
jgi:predicted glutamine amidotransferase